jgi:hypothetical protein
MLFAAVSGVNDMIWLNMAKIGFTGTQDGMTDSQKATLRDLLDGG